MIEIDGSFGEGGGQVLRSSMTLAAALSVPVRVSNIRARRARPGLQAQHLAAARAMAAVCAGRLEGGRKNSVELEFWPGLARAGRYSFQVGTAGSACLVLQTVLPALALAEGPSRISVNGGTHNPLAPPFEFIAERWLPALARIGLSARAGLVRPGFAPKGGGELWAELEPWLEPRRLELCEPVDWGAPEVSILIANLPDHVAFREQETLAAALKLDPTQIQIEALAGELGPGNAVLIRYRAAGMTAVVAGFGEPRKSAERVAAEAAREAKNFVRSGAPVDPHLADQLLLPLALAEGGAFVTSEITEHARAQAHVIKAFLGLEIEFKTEKPDRHRVEVPGASKAGRWRSGPGGV